MCVCVCVFAFVQAMKANGAVSYAEVVSHTLPKQSNKGSKAYVSSTLDQLVGWLVGWLVGFQRSTSSLEHWWHILEGTFNF